MTGRVLRFDPADERLARAAWSRLAEPTDAVAQRLVAQHGPVAALDQILRGRGQPRWRVRLPDLDPLADLERAQQDGARLVIPGDDSWPGGLDTLEEGRPFCLWVRGGLDLAAAAARCVAIVGARACTSYGERVALDLAAGCAQRGITVVSGAAYGIDAAAHRGALSRAGATIAVLACGVERAYPRGHDRLIARIAAEGCVVSEVPPGSAPTRWRFIERNRLIAALAQLVVVVEAGHRSGSLGTASRAANLGLVVGAVPGPVTSPMSYGPHRLLREGAVCVTAADEVAELLGPIGAAPADLPAVPSAQYDGLSAADLRVFDALPLRQAAGVPSLSTVAGLDLPAVRAALGRLELRGLAVKEGAGWRRAPSGPGPGRGVP
jgi:DNA processing protein